MQTITELTTLLVGNKIHAPKLKKDFILVDYKYNENFKEMIASLSPIDKIGNGFTIRFSDLIKLEYLVY